MQGISKTQYWIGGVLCIGVLLLTSFLFLYHLGNEPLQDYDEATYAEISVEALGTHTYISPTFLGTPFFRKPPLLFWLTDISDSIFSDPEFGARFVSAASGILLVGAVMLLLFEVTQNLFAAALGGVVLTTISSFVEMGRQSRFDVLVSLFNVLTLYTFVKGLQKRQWFLGMGVFLGLAVMAKGPIVIFAIIAVLVYAFERNSWRWLRDAYFWGGIGIAACIILPWHIYQTVHFGYPFWQQYLGDQVVKRISESLFNGPTNVSYFTYITDFAAPWSALFIAGLIGTPFFLHKLPLQVRAFFVSVVATVFAVLAVCLISKTKAISYLIPLYPFLALSLGLMGYALFQVRHQVVTAVCIGCAVVTILFASTLTIFNAFHINPYYGLQIGLTQEEYQIGTLLLAKHADMFYVYDVSTLGTIMFYSRILHPIGLGPGGTPPVHSYVLYETVDAAELYSAHPNISLVTLYSGTSLTLAEVVSED